MSIKTVSLGSAYRWLGEAFATCRAQPRLLLGAASLLLVAALSLSVIQAVIESIVPLPLIGRVLLQSLLSLVLFAPVLGGYYRLVDAVHHGRPAGMFDLFALFGDREAALRLIGTQLLFALLAMLVLGVPAYLFGGQELMDYVQTLGQLKPGAKTLPPMPEGMVPLLAGLAVAALLVSAAKELATAQAALAGRAAPAAAGDGIAATLRNIGAFLLFFLPVLCIGLVLASLFLLLAALLATALSLISPLLAFVILAPVALLVVLLLYVLMFSFFYHAWRDTMGAGTAPVTPDAGHQIEA